MSCVATGKVMVLVPERVKALQPLGLLWQFIAVPHLFAPSWQTNDVNET